MPHPHGKADQASHWPANQCMLTAERMTEWKSSYLRNFETVLKISIAKRARLVQDRDADFVSRDWSHWDNKAKIKTNRKPAGDFVAKPRGDGEVVGSNILSNLAWEDAAVAGQDRHRWWVLDYYYWYWMVGMIEALFQYKLWAGLIS